MAEIETAGGSVSIVALRHGINASLLFRWRRNLATTAPARRKCDSFVPVTLAAPVALPPPPPPPIVNRNVTPASSPSPIEIVLICGRTVRVDARPVLTQGCRLGDQRQNEEGLGDGSTTARHHLDEEPEPKGKGSKTAKK